MRAGVPPRTAACPAGLTLVEVAVVAAIAAVLTALAVPAYQGYLNVGKRQLLAQVLEVAQRCQQAVHSRVQAMEAQAVGQTNGYGCEVVWDPGPSKYVRQMTTSANGVITVVPHNTEDAAVDGQPVQLRPSVLPAGATQPVPLRVAQPAVHQGQRITHWQCAPALDNPQLPHSSSCGASLTHHLLLCSQRTGPR